MSYLVDNLTYLNELENRVALLQREVLCSGIGPST